MSLLTLLAALLIIVAIFAGVRLVAKAAKITIDPDLMTIIAVIIILLVLGYFFGVRLP